MPWWAGNPVAILMAVVVGIGIGFFLFPKEDNKNDPKNLQQWRMGNYTMLIIGAFGLWGLLIDAEKQVGQRNYEVALPRYRGDLNSWKSNLHFAQRYFCNTAFTKAPSSPSNFDDIVAEQKRLCDWSAKAVEKVDALNEENAKTFKIDQLGGFPDSNFFADVIGLVRNGFGWFDQSRHVLLEAQGQTKLDETKFVFTIFAPMLLGFAFGLSLVKAWRIP